MPEHLWVGSLAEDPDEKDVGHRGRCGTRVRYRELVLVFCVDNYVALLTPRFTGLGFYFRDTG